MTRTRRWAFGTAALAVLILLASWFLLVSPKRAEASDLQVQAQQQEQDNQALRGKLAALKAANALKPQQEAKLADFHVKVPGNPQLPALIRTLNAAAAQTGVDIDAVSPQNPSGVNVTPPTFTGVAVGQPNTPTTQLQQMTVSLNARGSYYALERFVNSLESTKRVTLVTGVDIKTGGSDESEDGEATTPTDERTMVLTFRVFLTSPAAPAAPAPSAQATAAPTVNQ
jgi:type IV pilus assembly protein PilO